MKKSIKKITLSLGVTLLTVVGIGAFSATTSQDKNVVSAFWLPNSTHQNKIYVSPFGKDWHRGTINRPVASLARAQQLAKPGDTVYLRGGRYTKFKTTYSDKDYNYINDFSKSNINYEGYKNEHVTFDFSRVPTDKRVAAFMVEPKAKNVTFKKFEVINVKVGSQKQSDAFRIMGKNITLDQISSHDNEANGVYYTVSGSGTVIRSDSYNNIGKGRSLGNTDGFGSHGDGVTFIEDRAWNNSDDGFDAISAHGPSQFINSWAFDQNAGGDSNGFKVGGYARFKTDFTPPIHTVTNCIAANNDQHGFYANHQPGQAATWTYNSSYNNKTGNFNMLETKNTSDPVDVPGTREVLQNNLSYKNNELSDANLSDGQNINNSWNKELGLNLNDSSFESLDVEQLKRPRGPHGELPEINFMKLKPSIINANVNISNLGYRYDFIQGKIITH